jgi:cardiolipin synthase
VEYFPPAQRAGAHYAQVFQSSIEGGAESMHLMYLLSIAAARRTIDLAMAYFAPDEIALEALLAALQRGVRVRILLPGLHTDAEIVQSASRAKWGSILAAGAEIYLYQPTMFHCKVLVVDGLWTSVGSTNFDTRSFRLNDEANLNIHDADVASRQIADFNNDLGKAHRVTYEEWAARPWTEKVRDRVASLLNAQL